MRVRRFKRLFSLERARQLPPRTPRRLFSGGENVFKCLGEDEGPRSLDDEKANKSVDHSGEDGTVGHVVGRQGCVATVRGLKGVKQGEMLRFQSNLGGMVMEIARKDIKVAILGDAHAIKADEAVSRTSRPVSIPMGAGYLGRIVDALGNPLDGQGEVEEELVSRPLTEAKNPPQYTTVPTTHEHILTRLKCFDVFQPLVKGGRFGVFGFPTSPKSEVALSIIENQATAPSFDADNMHFIYVCIGKSQKKQAEIIERLRESQMLDRTVVVCANEEAGDVLHYMAPLTGCLMSDFFRENGMHSLVVLDELAAHHRAYESLAKHLNIHKPSIVQVYAEILNHFGVTQGHNGFSGSSTVLALVDTLGGKDDLLEPHTEELSTFLDTALMLDEKLLGRNMFPGINIRTLVKGRPSPYQLPMVQGFYTRILKTLRATHRLHERAKMATDLGIDIQEESDVDIEDEISFPEKFEGLVNQLGEFPLHTSLIAMYFASESLLIGWTRRELKAYDAEVHRFLTAKRPELLELLEAWPADKEIPSFIFEDLQSLASEFSQLRITQLLARRR